MKSIIYAFLMIAVSSLAFSQTEKVADDFKIKAELQMRSELDGRDFSNKTYPLSFTSLRTRIGVEKKISNILLFVQLQDARLFGEAANTAGNLKATDLHQGYGLFSNMFDSPLSLQMGRFELNYNTGRIISSSQWGYTARSFDGAKLNLKLDKFSVDFLALTNTNSVGYLGQAIPDTSQYPFPSVPEKGYNVWGAWSKIDLFEGSTLDLFALYESNRAKTAKKNPSLARWTAGLNYGLKAGDFSLWLEGAYQFGTAGDQTSTKEAKDVAAYLAAINTSYKVSDFVIGLNFDVLSGTSLRDQAAGKETNNYDGSYMGKHTFFGYMDYFSNQAKGTKSLGVNDAYLRLEYKPKESNFSAQLDGHYFMTNKAYNINNESKTDLGMEFDLLLKYQMMKGVTFELGNCLFMQGDVTKSIYDINKTDGDKYDREDIGHWSYLMLRMAL